jgi:type IV secretion system protein VirD4
MQGDEFESRLRQDLPRGHAAQPKSAGRERGLFARWLTPEEMTGEKWSHEGGLLLGRRAGRLIGWKDDRHVMTIAGSRAGKGVSLIIPNLFRYEGSALVVDPKGENAAETAAWREEGLGQDVHVLDPFDVSGRPCSSFNPLAELDAEYPHLIEDAGLFADALITHPDRGEKHWTESAQALLRALILLVAGEDETRRNLITVRKLLMLSGEKIRDRQFAAAQKGQELAGQEALIQLLRAEVNRSYGHICVGLAEQLSAMGDNERGSVLSSARTQTQWLDDERIADVLCRSDFDIANLKRRKTTIYLCLPAMRMGTHARWFRLMILLALSVMERTRTKPSAPVLFVLDEFPVLGHMQAIETAAGLMAGFGVKLWAIMQNVGQLKQHYDKAWQTFMANAGVITAFGVTDQETLKVLSDKLGHMRMAEKVSTGAVGTALLSGAAPFREDHHNVPLLAEPEIELVFARDEKRVLILGAGLRPAVAERVQYYDPWFREFYRSKAN